MFKHSKNFLVVALLVSMSQSATANSPIDAETRQVIEVVAAFTDTIIPLAAMGASGLASWLYIIRPMTTWPKKFGAATLLVPASILVSYLGITVVTPFVKVVSVNAIKLARNFKFETEKYLGLS